MFVFFDDLLIYSKSWYDHLAHLRMIFDILQHHKLYLKRSKCSFGQSRVEYLGHIVSRDRVEVDLNRLQAIKDWHVPKNV